MPLVPDAQESLALTDFQVQVAQLFLSLPEAAGFLLAGGAGLVAQHLTTRPTQDLTSSPELEAQVFLPLGTPSGRQLTTGAGRSWGLAQAKESLPAAANTCH